MIQAAHIRRRRRSGAGYAVAGFSPGLTLDFARDHYRVGSVSEPFDTALAFTRTGTATYVDNTGTLQTAADGGPRIGHHIWDGSKWVNEGLLLESEARTNVVRYSNDLTEWTAIDSTITASGDMFKVVADSGAVGQAQAPNYTISESGKPVAISIDAEEDDARYMHIGRAGQGVWFDLRDGSALFATAGFTGDSVAIGATRRRYEVRFDETGLSNGATTALRVYPSVDAPSSSSASSGGGNDGTKGILVNNGQLEEDAPRASSHIVTGASTITRAAETQTTPSANLPYPEPQVIGSELVTNGTFDSDLSGWVEIETPDVTNPSGTLESTTNEGQNEGVQTQLVGTKTGSVYQVSFDLVAEALSGLAYVRFTASGSPAGPEVFPVASTTIGTNTAEFVADQDDGYLTFLTYGVTGHSFTIDNVSVREINPLAYSVAIKDTETYADEGTAGQVTLYDRRTDANNRITLTLDTDGAKTGTFTLTLVNSGSSETISTTGEITPGINVPFNVAIVATSNELGIALDGTAETRVSHTLGLPDLSTEDATYTGMGTRALIREWAADIDEAEASS